MLNEDSVVQLSWSIQNLFLFDRIGDFIFDVFKFVLFTEKSKIRASINFQTWEVPDFLPIKFGSPTGKSRQHKNSNL